MSTKEIKENPEERIALITGRSQSIGNAIAQKLSAENIKVVVYFNLKCRAGNTRKTNRGRT